MRKKEEKAVQEAKGKVRKFVKSLFGRGKGVEEMVEMGETSLPKRKLTRKEQEELNEKLLQAVIDNKIEEVKTYLKLGGDVNYKIKKDKTIHGFGFFENSTLLIIASGVGHIDIVDELIKNGADVNLQDQLGDTALIMAADQGHTDTCKLLIEHGVDVNIWNKWRRTALMYASWNGSIDTVRYLLSMGANPLLKNKTGQTAYDLTENEKKKQIIKRFEIIWENLESIGKEKVLELQLSIRNCSSDTVKEIIMNL